ncbi:hypothetical protein JCM10207_007857 [Rhodosporidiobolus poonsookiae]
MFPLPGRCELCDRLAFLRCCKCHDSLFCSIDCQKQAWPYHRWLCGKPADSFSFPPLSKREVELLKTLPTPEMDKIGLGKVGVLERLQERGWAGEEVEDFESLLDNLQKTPSPAAEPQRSLALAFLRSELYLAALCGAREITLNAWTYTSSLVLSILKQAKNSSLPFDDLSILTVLAPILKALLLYHVRPESTRTLQPLFSEVDQLAWRDSHKKRLGDLLSKALARDGRFKRVIESYAQGGRAGQLAGQLVFVRFFLRM